MSDVKFQCQECGKEFDPDPDTMRELSMTGECPCCDGISPEETEELLASGEAFTGEQLEKMSDYELSEIGLSPQDRDNLLAGASVSVGAICLCKDCQDSLAK
jgi:hypothetical protein